MAIYSLTPGGGLEGPVAMPGTREEWDESRRLLELGEAAVFMVVNRAPNDPTGRLTRGDTPVVMWSADAWKSEAGLVAAEFVRTSLGVVAERIFQFTSLEGYKAYRDRGVYDFETNSNRRLKLPPSNQIV